ncbi:MAG: fumarylacetoacetate hydrolase family protein [Thermoanaerobacteraceae bacterium]|nr:fumarylacetoacetate hydrolase family protein [Thermoanaerobacteraceae bacterium]
MRWVRFQVGGNIKYGIEEDGEITPVTGSPFGDYQVETEKFSTDQVTLLAPCEPSKILCVGLNYRDHAAEMKLDLPEQPVIFMKPSTAVIGPGADIVYPGISKRVDYEAELAVVVGREARDVPEVEAGRYILGYTCGNDVTARDLQPADGQWTISKSFDTFCPLGPVIETDCKADSLEIRLLLNGEEKQHSNTGQMVFSPQYLVSYLSRVMTLHPGDVILTGTPSGVGPVAPGDRVVVEIEEIGRLVNVVARHSATGK